MNPSDFLTQDEILSRLKARKSPARIMYSSYLGGWTDSPWAMHIPLDDHMVHRGDGVFEAIKYKNSRIFLLNGHIERLLKSAQMIALITKLDQQSLRKLIVETVQKSNTQNGIIRMYLSRGGGSFSPNPYDSKESQLFIAITDLSEVSSEVFTKGVRVGISDVPQKQSWLASVKSCNYLNNVLMKKEAIDQNLDFMIGLGPSGELLEGPTENIVIMDKKGQLCIPQQGSILEGITLQFAIRCAQEWGVPVLRKKIYKEDIKKSDGAIMLGTTIDALPVVEFDGQTLKRNNLVDQFKKRIDESFLSNANQDVEIF